MIRSWMVSLKNDGNAATTINRKISALKSFYKYLMQQGKVSTQPLETVSNVKMKKKLPLFVQESGMDDLLNADFGDDDDGKIEKLIIYLLYATGMRKSELIGLKSEHIDLSARLIKVFGKGKKERNIPVHGEVLELLRDRIVSSHGTHLFTQKNGKPLDPKQVYNIVKKAFVIGHHYRKTFSTHSPP